MRPFPGACVLIFLALSAHGASPAWSQLPAGGAAPHARYGHSAVYDSASNRMIVFGGRYGGPNDPQSSTGVLSDLWILTNANGNGGPSQWLNVTPPSSPPATWGHSAIYDPVANTMVIAGGTTGFNNPCTCDVWLLTNANGVSGTPAWSRLPISCMAGSVGPRTMMPAAFNAASTGMLLVGGSDCSNGGQPQTWLIGNASSTAGAQSWIHLTPGGTKLDDSLRLTGASIYDANNDRMVIWGATFAYPLNRLYVLDNGAGRGTRPLEWSILTTSSAPGTAANSGPVAIYNSANNRAVFFGGVVPGSGFPQLTGATNETWRLDNANGLSGTPSWSRVTLAGASPAARTMNSAVYDSASDRMIIFGGGADGGSTSFNDVWILDSATGGTAAPNNPLQLTPPSISFGTVNVGSASSPQSANLVNTTVPVAPGIPITITISGDFQQTNTCPSSILPSQSCIINVTFTPAAAGVRSGTLTVTPSSGTAVQTTLTGTGASAAGLTGAFTINGTANSNTALAAATGQALTFTASEPSNATFQWNFGDGSSGAGRTVQHAFASAGTFTITLTVTSGSSQVTGTGRVLTSNPSSAAVRRRVLQPPQSITESTSKIISAAAGGTLTLPSGPSVRFDAGALPRDLRVTITKQAALGTTVPGGILKAAGPALSIDFAPLTPKGSSATSVTGTVSITLPVPAQLASEAISYGVAWIQSPQGCTSLVAAIQAFRNAANVTMTIPAGFLSVAAVRGGAASTVTVAPAQYSADRTRVDTSRLGLRILPGAQQCWTGLTPNHQFKPDQRVCVFVHGVLSSVEGAYPTGASCGPGCITALADKNACDVVAGFNYDWTADTEVSSNLLAQKLNSLVVDGGARHLVIEAHSLGGVVTLGALSKVPNLPIDSVITLGSPLFGTPAAQRAEDFMTSEFIYGVPAGEFWAAVLLGGQALGTDSSLRGDLLPGSLKLNGYRTGFRQNYPLTPLIVAGGTRPALPCAETIFGDEKNDGIVNLNSALAVGFENAGPVERLDPFDLAHTDLECNQGVIDKVAAKLDNASTVDLTVKLAGFLDPLTGEDAVMTDDGSIRCLPSCANSYNRNSSVTLKASYGENYEFVSWTGDCTGTSTSCSMTMDRSRTVTATYRPASFTVSPAQAVLSAPQGSNATPQTFTISNQSNIPLFLTFHASADWIALPFSIDVKALGTAAFSASFDTKPLDPGVYKATIDVELDTKKVSIPVTLTINAVNHSPALSVHFAQQSPRNDSSYGDYTDPDGDAKTIEYTTTAYAVFHNAAGDRTSGTATYTSTATLTNGSAGSQYLTGWNLTDAQIADARAKGDTSITQFSHVHAQAVDAAGNRSAFADQDHSITLDMRSVLVTISPNTATVAPGQSQQFTAAVSGTSNTAVTWKTTGGSISAGGLYTAPQAAGTYYVTATSVADPTAVSEAATVTVTSSGGGGGGNGSATLVLNYSVTGGPGTRTGTLTWTRTATISGASDPRGTYRLDSDTGGLLTPGSISGRLLLNDNGVAYDLLFSPRGQLTFTINGTSITGVKTTTADYLVSDGGTLYQGNVTTGTYTPGN